jgi:AcrR family transcriptional regulator
MLSDRQIEIINKSIDIIDRKGIQGLTIKNLSKEIGISEPAIYRHFKSKTDIILAILKNFEEMSKFLLQSVTEMNDKAIDKIEFIFSKILDIFSKEPSHITVIFSEEIFKNEDILRKKITDIMNNKQTAIEDIILSGQNAGEIRTDINYKTLALLVMGALRFKVKQWDLKNQKENLLQEGKELIVAIKQILKN